VAETIWWPSKLKASGGGIAANNLIGENGKPERNY
jgi:hypothetical protein